MENGTISTEARVGHASNSRAQALPVQRHPGRPSTVAEFAPQIRAWLEAEPTLSGAALLSRARLAGYRGGKSALYEQVRRLRQPAPANHSSFLQILTGGAAAAAHGEITPRPSKDSREHRAEPTEREARTVPDDPPAERAEARPDQRQEQKFMRCRCGGPLRFDLEHLADAERLGLREQVPLFWKCIICGRSRRSDESYPLTRIVASLNHFASMGPAHDPFAHRNGGPR